ncbi:MAG: hypothetical protein V4677_09565 [Bacteroidota bacterium]
MLVINLSYNAKDFLEYKKECANSDSLVLDITGALSNEVIKGSIDIGTLQENYTIFQQAITDMIDAIGKASLLQLNNNEQVRDLNLNGLNLFWQTTISEKYPTHSFLINLFYLKIILKEKLESINFKSVYIILPSIHETVYIKSITKFFQQNYQIEQSGFNIDFKSTESNGSLFKKIKSTIIETLFFKKNIESFKVSKKNFQLRNYAVIPVHSPSWKQAENRDRVLGFIVDGSQGAKGTYLPYFSDLFATVKWNVKWDLDYIHSFPTKFQLAKHYFSKFNIYKKIRKIRDLNVTDINFVDGNVIYSELKMVLSKNYYFVNFLWMKNFFSSMSSPSNIFYYCEFYKQRGRVISQAVNRCNNPKVKSYGFQHGIIYKGHTIYNLTRTEMECTKAFNGLPKPQHFILWGKYFKDILNTHNAFADSELLVAGNPNYLGAFKKHTHRKHKNEVPTFLWCTTLEVLAKKELDIIQPFLNGLNSYKLLIRCHPGHQIQNHVLGLFNEESIKNVSICDKKDVFDAICTIDYVFAAVASTIFMDALMLNKIVFQLQTDIFYNALIPSPNAYIVNSSNELNELYTKLKLQDTEKNFVKEQTILHLNESTWEEILN